MSTPDGSVGLAHYRTAFDFVVDGSPEMITELFGAHRERSWDPSWDPKFLHPQPAQDCAGAVFLLPAPHHGVGMTTTYDPVGGHVQHAFLEPGTVAILIDIEVMPCGEGASAVSVTYEHTALDPDRIDDVRDMARQVAGYGPEWRTLIAASLAGDAS